MKRGGPIARRSTKRAAQERTYAKRRAVFMAEWPTCQSPDACGRPSQDLHHMQGRVGALLLDESRWMALCRECHRHFTENPALAIAQGVSYPRVGIAS